MSEELVLPTIDDMWQHGYEPGCMWPCRVCAGLVGLPNWAAEVTPSVEWYERDRVSWFKAFNPWFDFSEVDDEEIEDFLAGTEKLFRERRIWYGLPRVEEVNET